jgi:hypothetical protein
MRNQAVMVPVFRAYVLSSVTLALLLVHESVAAQNPLIGIIDFYGLRHVAEKQARETLKLAEGDVVPQSVTEAEQRLASLPGVVSARVSRVCCDDGKAIVYVGLEEKGTEVLRFRGAASRQHPSARRCGAGRGRARCGDSAGGRTR